MDTIGNAVNCINYRLFNIFKENFYIRYTKVIESSQILDTFFQKYYVLFSESGLAFGGYQVDI